MRVNLERARQIMARERLDALIGALSENVIYLTDTEAHLSLSHAIERDADRDFYAILPRREDIQPTYVCAASTSTFLVRRLKRGDVIRLDVGGTYKHYWSDTAKVGVLGAPAPESYRRAMAALLAAREAYQTLLRPGTPVADLLRVGEATVRMFNLPAFKRLWGPGIGLQWYEWPRVTRDSRDVLEAGMVLNMEGGPSAVPWGGVNLEMTYCITRDGFECWTKNNDFVWEP